MGSARYLPFDAGEKCERSEGLGTVFRSLCDIQGKIGESRFRQAAVGAVGLPASVEALPRGVYCRHGGVRGVAIIVAFTADTRFTTRLQS